MTETHPAGPRPGPRPYRRRPWDEPGITPDLARARVHALVRELHGSATLHPCADCGQPAAHWSYTYAPGEPYVRGAFGPPERYLPRCRTCHGALDATAYRLGHG